MSKVTSDQSLSLITKLDKVLKDVSEYNDVLTKIKELPLRTRLDSLIDNSEELKQKLTKISKALPLIYQGLKDLKYLYQNEDLQCQTLREVLLEEIDKREKKDLQLNTMASLYNEENLMTDITVPISSDDFSVQSIRMDQIIDPKDYSCWAIVKKFESENSTISLIFKLFQRSFDTSISAVLNSIDRVTELRSRYEDGEIAVKLADPDTPDSESMRLFDDFFLGIWHLVDVFKEVKKIFQISMEIQHNFEIYTKAVKSYTSITLESVFNPNSKYEI